MFCVTIHEVLSGLSGLVLAVRRGIGGTQTQMDNLCWCLGADDGGDDDDDDDVCSHRCLWGPNVVKIYSTARGSCTSANIGERAARAMF